MNDSGRLRKIENILKKARNDNSVSFSVQHVIVTGAAELEHDDESLPPPAFGATLVSPPDHPFRVFVGSVSDAMYMSALKDHNIVAILNVAYAQCIESQRIMKMSTESNSQWHKVEFSQTWYKKNLNNPNFMYLGISAEDHPRYKIRKHFDECLEFIDEVGSRENRGDGPPPGVLVHCMQGYNRSVAICAAWLLRRTKFPLEEIVGSISTKRPLVLSNRAFIRELIQFDEELNGDHQKDEIKDHVVQKIFSLGDIIERL